MPADASARPSLNTLVNDALVAYATFVGLTEDGWRDQEELRLLNESRELDPSGATTFMLLRGALDAFLDETSFPAKEILANPDAFLARLAEIRAVLATVEHPDAEAIVADLQGALRRAADTFDLADRAAFEAFLGEKRQLGLVRRDALRSLTTLQTYAFTKGALDTARLAVNRTIFECWNINSLLHLLQQQAMPGVSLCLIRDPEMVMESYFVFAVKSGDVMAILTDRTTGPHPDHAKMSRRRDRALADRAAMHWFPYRLLNLRAITDAEGRHRGLAATSRTGLVRQQTHIVPLSTLGALEPEEFAWTVLVLEALAAQYSATAALPPAAIGPDAPLAYTGEMLVEPHVLVGPSAALVRQGDYAPLALAPLTTADLTADIPAAGWQEAPVGHNHWMIDTYGADLPTDVFNVVGERAAQHLTAGLRAELASHPHGGDLRELETAEGRALSPAERAEAERDALARVQLRSIEPTSFGTVAQLERDRLWMARRNQMLFIQARAVTAFERDKAAVLAWCHARLTERLPALIEAAVRGAFVLPHAGRHPDFTRGWLRDERDALDLFDAKSGRHRTGAFRFYEREHTRPRPGYRRPHVRRVMHCAVQPDRPAATLAAIYPTCPEALAVLYGVELNALPLGLRHWYAVSPYTGNQILGRLDPSDWDLENPWCALKLDVLLGLSRTGRKQVAKRLGVPVDPPTRTP